MTSSPTMSLGISVSLELFGVGAKAGTCSCEIALGLFREPALRPYSLQLRNASAGAVFVLLPGAATDAAGTLDDTIAYDRDCSLAYDYVAALRRDHPARGSLVGAIRHLAARTAEPRAPNRTP